MVMMNDEDNVDPPSTRNSDVPYHPETITVPGKKRKKKCATRDDWSQVDDPHRHRENGVYTATAFKEGPNVRIGVAFANTKQGSCVVVYKMKSTSMFANTALKVGDEILSVNNENFQGKSSHDVANFIKEQQGFVTVLARPRQRSSLPPRAKGDVKVDATIESETQNEPEFSLDSVSKAKKKKKSRKKKPKPIVELPSSLNTLPRSDSFSCSSVYGGSQATDFIDESRYETITATVAKTSRRQKTGVGLKKKMNGTFLVNRILDQGLFAETELRVGDEVVTVNGFDSITMAANDVEHLFGSVTGRITLVARRAIGENESKLKSTNEDDEMRSAAKVSSRQDAKAKPPAESILDSSMRLGKEISPVGDIRNHVALEESPVIESQIVETHNNDDVAVELSSGEKRLADQSFEPSHARTSHVIEKNDSLSVERYTGRLIDSQSFDPSYPETSHLVDKNESDISAENSYKTNAPVIEKNESENVVSVERYASFEKEEKNKALLPTYGKEESIDLVVNSDDVSPDSYRNFKDLSNDRQQANKILGSVLKVKNKSPTRTKHYKSKENSAYRSKRNKGRRLDSPRKERGMVDEPYVEDVSFFTKATESSDSFSEKSDMSDAEKSFNDALERFFLPLCCLDDEEALYDGEDSILE